MEVVATELTLTVVACRAPTFFADARDARETVAKPEMGMAGGERMGESGDWLDVPEGESSRPAAIRRTPSLRAALAVGMRDDTAVTGVVDVDSGEVEGCEE